MSDKNSLDLSDDEEDVEVGAMNANVAQEISGTLSKWTNYIHGWQDRYIVVKDGVMAYYKSQQDTGYGCRGSVSIRQASIKVCFSVALLSLATLFFNYVCLAYASSSQLCALPCWTIYNVVPFFLAPWIWWVPLWCLCQWFCLVFESWIPWRKTEMADISGKSQSMMLLEVLAFVPFIYLSHREEEELGIHLIFADGIWIQQRSLASSW